MNRRTLLRQGGSLLATAGASSLFAQKTKIDTGATASGKVSFPPIDRPTEVGSKPPNPDPASKRVGVAVIGLGRLAVEQILPAFGSAKHVRLTGLVSGTPEKAITLADQYGVARSSVYDYSGLERMADNQDIEAVYIVLPNSMHREFVLRAAKAGKHVLCEKPMALNSSEAEEMIQGCVAAKRKLMIAYRMQYEPLTLELIRMCRAGELGTIATVSAMNGQNQGDPAQWRLRRAMSGGGSLPDVGIYCVNAARYITGEEPVQVSAVTFSSPDDPRFREVEETVAWSMRFPGGCVANLLCSYGAHETRTLDVHGTDAHASMSPAFGYHGQRLSISRRASASFQHRIDVETDPNDQFALEMDHFAQCIRTDSTPKTPGQEGLRDHRIMEAIYRSAESGRVAKLTS